MVGPRQTRSQSMRARRSARPYWLFALFCLYGPSFSVVGELRYVEVFLLGLLLFNINRVIRFVGPWSRRLAVLFLLAACAQIVSDCINEASVFGTLKRGGTYVILALMVIIISWLGRNDFTRIRYILSGYCWSSVFILFVGTSTSAGYEETPWRLGLGGAATLLLCVMIAS